MMTSNYSDLTINQILELADGDLDDSQLASRLARRIALDVRKRIGGGLSTEEQNDLDALRYVIDNQFKVRGTK
jgi:hypothetical protein